MKHKTPLFLHLGLLVIALSVSLYFAFHKYRNKAPKQPSIWEQQYNELSERHKVVLEQLAQEKLKQDSVYVQANDSTKNALIMQYARALSMYGDSISTDTTQTPK